MLPYLTSASYSFLSMRARGIPSCSAPSSCRPIEEAVNPTPPSDKSSNGKHAKSSGFITEHSAAITLMVNVVGFTDVWVSFNWLNCST